MGDEAATDTEEPPVHHVRAALLGVRLVGFGPVEAVARRARTGEDVVTATLAWAQRRSLVSSRWASFPGWSLTAEGRRHGERLLADEVAALGVAAEVREAYDGFLALNQRFLALCTSWQLKPLPGNRFEPNGHDDPSYDLRVLAGLAAVDDEIEPVLEALSAALERYGDYRSRLANARRMLETGDGDWFTRPVIDSYHTVWFELHEDLLATLGLERSGEREA